MLRPNLRSKHKPAVFFVNLARATWLKLTVFVNAQGFACAGLTVLHSDMAIGSHALPCAHTLLSEALSPFGSLRCSNKSNGSSQQQQMPRLIALSCA